MTVSNYLYELNRRWSSSALPYGPDPRRWGAIAGTVCQDPVRQLLGTKLTVGCSDGQPDNDGVVCEQSAVMDPPRPNGPNPVTTAPQYAHTKNAAVQYLMFPCNASEDGVSALDDPGSDLITLIAGFIKQAAVIADK